MKQSYVRIFLGLEELRQLVLDRFEADGLEEFLFKLWLMWKHLCDIKHGTKTNMDSLGWFSADLMLRNYHKDREKICIEQQFLPAEGLSKWYLPPKDVIRLDVDATVRDDGGRVGAGFIARDSEGKIVLAGCQRIGATTTVLMGELHAILLAVGSCLTHDVGPVVLYTDSLLAVHVLHDHHQSADSICEELVEAFDHTREHVVLDFFHAHREAKRAAHALASFTFDCQDVMIWKSSFPPWLLNIALSDSS